MNFKDGMPIFQQIAERLSDEILCGEYAAEARVPGVREYAALLEVNANDLLAARGVIYAKRGMGYYVSPDAQQRILAERRTYFREHAMPDFFRQMQLLGISGEDIARDFATWQQAQQ